MKTAGFRIEGGHGARAVDADQPVGFGAADRGIGQPLHFGAGAQLRENPSLIACCVIDCSHRRSTGLPLLACCAM